MRCTEEKLTRKLMQRYKIAVGPAVQACGLYSRCLTALARCYRFRPMRRAFFTMLAIEALGAAIPAPAHHSFSAEFDGGKLIELKGVVTRIEWANPHVYFYVDVKDEKGDHHELGMRSGQPWFAAPPRLESRFAESGRSGGRRRLSGTRWL